MSSLERLAMIGVSSTWYMRTRFRLRGECNVESRECAMGVGVPASSPTLLGTPEPPHQPPVSATPRPRLNLTTPHTYVRSHHTSPIMSTIASPRASIAGSIRSPSSTRTSFETTSRPHVPGRRNRAALRDYYGLKTSAVKDADSKISEESTRTDLGPEDDETLTELDSSTFNAEDYVNNVLATSGLSGVLKVEADLVSQIRNLDSDRKSLVYDNYSKLLAATSTIRRMRTNMDPLAPTTHTLGPAISHIAETAASLSSQKHVPERRSNLGLGISVVVEGENGGGEAERKTREKETVKWVLDTPRRLRELIDQEKEDEAEEEWGNVAKVLKKWWRVEGVKELWEECEHILGEEEEDSS
jgi:hypothetical protein